MGDADVSDLLEGLEGDAREARLRLVRDLLDDGCPIDEIRAAAAEDRLALLPVDRVLRTQATHSLRDIAEETGVPLDVLRRGRSALGLTLGDDDEPRYGERDVENARSLRAVLDSGIPLESVVEFNRVVGRAMLQVAAASRAMVADAVFKPGTDEHNVGVMAAAGARDLVPRMSPTLAFVYEAHLRELLRSDVISSADIAAGRTPGAREMAVAFADLVGFTRLGEQVPAEELGDVVGRLESAAADRVAKPVTFVKTLGDAVMLVAPTPDPLIEVCLDLVEAFADDDLGLRAGIACGPALERAGDWYGSPVNQASRATTIARPGSVLVTQSVRDHAARQWRWSFAGERRLKGVGPARLHRVRRSDDQSRSGAGIRS